MKIASNEVVEYMQGAVSVVEANTFEVMCLWRENKDNWVSVSSGYGICVGGDSSIERQTAISLSSALIGGKKVLFIYPTSVLVDWDLIDSWLSNNLPASVLIKTDAGNFHNAV
tara:strand:+ start:315 stop:653 length:339 start_codon:yes stop_codon:yes gene_type:complete